MAGGPKVHLDTGFQEAYKIKMDRKAALKILDLDDNASLEEAKKAYRSLAKKNHPDLLRESFDDADAAESKMKEINLAFRYLVPHLKSGIAGKKEKVPEKDPIKEKSVNAQNKNLFSFFSDVSEFFKIKSFHKPEKQSKKEKPGQPGKKRQKAAVRFDEVFKTVHRPESISGRKKKKKKRPSSQGSDPFERYKKYMALKRKLKARRSGQNQDMGTGRVEKIERVRPVNPVGRD